MVYTPNLVRHIGMIAGGTGITPMLQIIRAVVRNRPRNGGNDRTEIDLLFANVNQEDILLRDDLDKLTKEDSGIRVHHVLNNPPEGWTGGVGFVTADMMKVRGLLLFVSVIILILLTGQLSLTSKGYQGAHLRPPTHGECHEESDRITGLRKGEGGQ